jgi:lysophospholipase L1-like esterase
VATDLGCELIPIHNYWAGYLEEQNLSSKDLTLSDSRYPNERGHKIIAEAVMKWLDKILPHDP